MKNIFTFLLVITASLSLKAQELKAYAIYNTEGDSVSFQKMNDSLSNYDVVLFGEFHDHPVVHWLQKKLTEKLYAKNSNLVLGAEMFEADNQLILDEYLQGKIPQNRFEEEMRLWNNYKTDYKPLIEFAKTNNLQFVATNIPRRYASAVSKYGLDTLKTYSKEAQSYYAKLPIKVDTITPGYGDMLKMMGGHGMQGDAMKFVGAQAIKDATMAENILKNAPQDGVFLHYNGDYHSKNFGGIYWYLKEMNANLKIAVISVAQSEDEMLSFDKKTAETGNFIIYFPEDFTRTY
ncbi:ChaN family lipoprotein [Zunongwangia endophytica]|uniref:ChaN family lipoprotein n=1 Tax=Zunongwangia endophytica TaxID=1808945 RepID=A0ABV8H683_9FLAO|nr:ChaN family lipoprotein [Zunongwangia endophytica]MDN3596132.1 ChaN family lipoprotein [Zunongwangia endophytica]